VFGRKPRREHEGCSKATPTASQRLGDDVDEPRISVRRGSHSKSRRSSEVFPKEGTMEGAMEGVW